MLKWLITVALVAIGFSNHAEAQYTVAQWGINKTGGSPYPVCLNLSGNWGCIGTISSAGVFTLTATTVSPPAGSNGQVQVNNSGTMGGITIGGDASLNASTGALTVTKTSGTAFAASATTDATNASNITSGTLPPARLSKLSYGSPNSVPALSVLDYGAIADGNIANAAVNIAAVNSILALGRCVYFPQNSTGTADYNMGTNSISLAQNQCLRGEQGVKITYTGTGGAIQVTAYEIAAAPARIEGDLTLNMGGSSGTGILFKTSGGVVAGFMADHILCLNATSCIQDEASANYVTDIRVNDLRAIGGKGTQIYLRHSRGFTFFDTVRIDYNEAGQTTPVTWNSAVFEDFVGLEINRFDVVGPTTDTTYRSGATGLVITGGTGYSSVWLGRVLVESGSGNGVAITTVNMLYANWLTSYAMLGRGIVLSGVTNSNISNVLAYGGTGRTGASAGKVGFQITGVSNAVNVSNVTSTLNTGVGVSVTGSGTSILLNNVASYSNGTYNFETGGSADYVTVNGGYMASAGTANTTLGSSGTHNSIVNVGGVLGGWNAGATSPVGIGATSNYGVLTFNGYTTLLGMLGVFGGASGDANTLYLSAPSAVELYNASTFRPSADNIQTLGLSGTRWSTSYAYTQDAKIYHTTQASVPTLTSCGTGSSVDAGSSNNAGKITFGSGTTSCTASFATAYPTYAYCTVTPAAQPAAVGNIPYISAQAKTSFTIAGGTASASYYYTCGGN